MLGFPCRSIIELSYANISGALLFDKLSLSAAAILAALLVVIPLNKTWLILDRHKNDALPQIKAQKEEEKQTALLQAVISAWLLICFACWGVRGLGQVECEIRSQRQRSDLMTDSFGSPLWVSNRSERKILQVYRKYPMHHPWRSPMLLLESRLPKGLMLLIYEIGQMSI